jgi:hypothetical protein
MKNTDSELLKELKNKFNDEIDDRFYLPKAYWTGNKEMIKAIYLGCDPTNTKKNIQFDFAFSHGCNDKCFVLFRNKHLKQLEAIDLNWDMVYTQNLCRNYFKSETSKNKIWKYAAEFWIDLLKKELNNLFTVNIPVLLTSQLLLDVLLIEKKRPEDYDAQMFYDLKTQIPINPEKNKLGRPLIPFYRGVNGRTKVPYKLEVYPDYAKEIKKVVHMYN